MSFLNYFRLTQRSQRAYALYLADQLAAVDAVARAAAATAQAAADLALTYISTGLGAYNATQTDSLQRWLAGETIYRKVVTIPAGPNNNTVTIAHGIANLLHVTRVGGTLKNGSNIRITFPHDPGNALGGGMGVNIDQTNISLNSTINLSGFSGFMVLEWVAS